MPKSKQPKSFPVVSNTGPMPSRQPLPAISFKGESEPYTRLFNKLMDRRWPPYVAQAFCDRLFPALSHRAQHRVVFTLNLEAGPPF